MSKIKITFHDSSSKEYNSGISCLDIVKSISNSLAKKVLVVSYNNNLIDISTQLFEDGSIKFEDNAASISKFANSIMCGSSNDMFCEKHEVNEQHRIKVVNCSRESS